MSLNTPQQIAEIAVESGVKKAHLSLSSLMILGFLAALSSPSDFFSTFM